MIKRAPLSPAELAERSIAGKASAEARRDASHRAETSPSAKQGSSGPPSRQAVGLFRQGQARSDTRASRTVWDTSATEPPIGAINGRVTLHLPKALQDGIPNRIPRGRRVMAQARARAKAGRHEDAVVTNPEVALLAHAHPRMRALQTKVAAVVRDNEPGAIEQGKARRLIPEGTHPRTVARAYKHAALTAMHRAGIIRYDTAMDEAAKAEFAPLVQFMRYAQRRVFDRLNVGDLKGSWVPFRNEFGYLYQQKKHGKFTGLERMRMSSREDFLKIDVGDLDDDQLAKIARSISVDDSQGHGQARLGVAGRGTAGQGSACHGNPTQGGGLLKARPNPFAKNKDDDETKTPGNKTDPSRDAHKYTLDSGRHKPGPDQEKPKNSVNVDIPESDAPDSAIPPSAVPQPTPIAGSAERWTHYSTQDGFSIATPGQDGQALGPLALAALAVARGSQGLPVPAPPNGVPNVFDTTGSLADRAAAVEQHFGLAPIKGMTEFDDDTGLYRVVGAGDLEKQDFGFRLGSVYGADPKRQLARAIHPRLRHARVRLRLNTQRNLHHLLNGGVTRTERWQFGAGQMNKGAFTAGAANAGRHLLGLGRKAFSRMGPKTKLGLAAGAGLAAGTHASDAKDAATSPTARGIAGAAVAGGATALLSRGRSIGLVRGASRKIYQSGLAEALREHARVLAGATPSQSLRATAGNAFFARRKMALNEAKAYRKAGMAGIRHPLGRIGLAGAAGAYAAQPGHPTAPPLYQSAAPESQEPA